MIDLKHQLIEYGFSDKEANVYLAMLELGPSSAQEIAKKAGVNRATTYVMIESLKRRGLMSSVERGKKICFAAESPQHLLVLMRQEEQRIEQKRRGFESLMPQFMALFNAVDDKPRVRFFEGEEGISAGREAIEELLRGNKSAYVFIHYDKEMADLARMNEHVRHRLASSVKDVRILYSIDEGVEAPSFRSHVQARKIPAHVQPFSGELNIYDSVLMLAVASPRPMLVIVESPGFTLLMKRFFELSWSASEKK
jgi:sugar-specific transcriptional regulator TrmB